MEDVDSEGLEGPETSKAFSARLNHLITTVYPAALGRPYTHGEISRGIGLTTTAIGHLRSGRSQPKLDTADRLAKFFGVPLDYFTDDAVAEETDKQLALASAMRNSAVERVALRAAGLPPDVLAAVSAVIDQFRLQTGLGDTPDWHNR
ncbi:helix-turn-helix transcriptional regulator [Streptomyces sp. NPDC094034]|uniref:helix-turn-helix domain-containing protein n=1 Tax=Streptomyces sp. NPDC094034 TaxID=3155309 RepID=UPI00331F250F